MEVFIKFSTKKLALIGVLGAIVCVLTIYPQIPVPATNGYIHLGDAAVFVTAALLDPVSAAFAAGIGSSLADLISGYAHWMLPTLMIKGLMAIFLSVVVKNNLKHTTLGVGMLGSGFIMIVGYFIAGGIMKGNWEAPMFSVPFNLIQFAAGFVVAFVVISALVQRGIHRSN